MNVFVLINVVLLILFNIKYGFATNYCAKNLCDIGKKHIACKNNGNFSKNCSTNARLINMNHYKELILRAHNVRRNNLARGLVPGYRPASRMATMQWSNELAYLASLNVRQCAMKHDQCHNTYAFPTASQNLGFIGNTRLFAFFRIDWIIKNRINDWWQEYKLINMTVIQKFPSNFNSTNFLHFTTMAAESNTHVGCGLSLYTQNEFNIFLFACNYATVNFIGMPVYSAGRTASTCRTGVNHVYRGLCSNFEAYRVARVRHIQRYQTHSNYYK